MATTVFSPDTIYTGFWIDHGYGNNPAGLTLTLTSSSSVYLIAFLALFVKVAGNYSWDLICYIIFQVQSTLKPRSVLHHQQQALLRTRLSDTKTAVALLRLYWAWKGKTPESMSRTIPLALAAIFHVTAFIICGIFSSKVAQAHSIVLLLNGTCGETTLDVTNATQTAQYFTMVSNTQLTASIYSEQCYVFNETSTGFSSPVCDVYGRNSIRWTIDDNITCPFERNMCRDHVAVRFDTGFIDSVSPITKPFLLHDISRLPLESVALTNCRSKYIVLFHLCGISLGGLHRDIDVCQKSHGAPFVTLCGVFLERYL